MNIFWDVDGTIMSFEDGYPIRHAEKRTLRPHAKEVIEMLEGIGIKNYIWSRAGQGNACEAAHRLGLDSDRCFSKPEFDSPEDLKSVPVKPDLVIDDRDDESILLYPHVLVSTYKGGDDDELLGALKEIREFFDSFAVPDELSEVKVKFKRRKRTPMAVKMKRKRYYRRHRSKYRRYRKRYRRRPRAKRINKIRRRIQKRLGTRAKRLRVRVTV